MKDLLEKMTFAGEPEQKPGDQVRGTDKVKTVKRTVPYQKHPLQGKLVGAGAAEESVEHIADQLRKELEEYGAPGSGISSGTDMDRTQVRQMRKDQKAQQQQADSQEDDIENQIKGLTQQSVAASNQPVPPPNPNDPASVAQFAAASRQKRAEKQQIALQKRSLNQAKKQFS
jgi:hypothetical protein